MKQTNKDRITALKQKHGYRGSIRGMTEKLLHITKLQTALKQKMCTGTKASKVSMCWLLRKWKWALLPSWICSAWGCDFRTVCEPIGCFCNQIIYRYSALFGLEWLHKSSRFCFLFLFVCTYNSPLLLLTSTHTVIQYSEKLSVRQKIECATTRWILMSEKEAGVSTWPSVTFHPLKCVLPAALGIRSAKRGARASYVRDTSQTKERPERFSGLL